MFSKRRRASSFLVTSPLVTPEDVEISDLAHGTHGSRCLDFFLYNNYGILLVQKYRFSHPLYDLLP